MSATDRLLGELSERFLLAEGHAPQRGERSEVTKDRDRLIHSSAFRRLQGKSQIVGVEAGDFFRTRLTHSLECAQIGRAVAARVIGDTDTPSVVDDPTDLPDLVEAACLAHDLGHPPFGHNGEVALSNRMQKYDRTSFEGNAQSFRIVTFIEAKRFGPTQAGGAWRWVGLDLTRSTLRALMKYPWHESSRRTRQHDGKFGVYDDPIDRDYYRWIWDGARPAKNLAAKIMDFSDDVAYAVHDFEDGVFAGMIPLYELLHGNERATEALGSRVLKIDEKKKVDERLFAHDEFSGILAGLLDSEALALLRQGQFDRTRYARAALKDFTASLIHEFIHETTVRGQFTPAQGDLRRRLEVLKAMAWEWMILRSDLETYKHGQQEVIRRIFDAYWAHRQMLPRREEVRVIESSSRRRPITGRWPEMARFIRDHISGMTDAYALEVSAQMFSGRQARDLRLSY